jgi:hypothetical protein
MSGFWNKVEDGSWALLGLAHPVTGVAATVVGLFKGAEKDSHIQKQENLIRVMRLHGDTRIELVPSSIEVSSFQYGSERFSSYSPSDAAPNFLHDPRTNTATLGVATSLELRYAGSIGMLYTRGGKVWRDSSSRILFWHPDEAFQPRQALDAWVKADGYMKVKNAL